MIIANERKSKTATCLSWLNTSTQEYTSCPLQRTMSTSGVAELYLTRPSLAQQISQERTFNVNLSHCVFFSFLFSPQYTHKLDLSVS